MPVVHSMEHASSKDATAGNEVSMSDAGKLVYFQRNSYQGQVINGHASSSLLVQPLGLVLLDVFYLPTFPPLGAKGVVAQLEIAGAVNTLVGPDDPPITDPGGGFSVLGFVGATHVSGVAGGQVLARLVRDLSVEWRFTARVNLSNTVPSPPGGIGVFHDFSVTAWRLP